MKETILINWYLFEVMYINFCLKFFDDKCVYAPTANNVHDNLVKNGNHILTFFDELEKNLERFLLYDKTDESDEDRIVLPRFKRKNRMIASGFTNTYDSISNMYIHLVNQQLVTFNFHFKLFIYKFGFT